MDGLDDFLLFNACEDAREESERENTNDNDALQPVLSQSKGYDDDDYS